MFKKMVVSDGLLLSMAEVRWRMLQRGRVTPGYHRRARRPLVGGAGGVHLPLGVPGDISSCRRRGDMDGL